MKPALALFVDALAAMAYDALNFLEAPGFLTTTTPTKSIAALPPLLSIESRRCRYGPQLAARPALSR